jgi:hypothetical protein
VEYLSREGQDHFPSDPIEFTQSVALGRLSDEAGDLFPGRVEAAPAMWPQGSEPNDGTCRKT